MIVKELKEIVAIEIKLSIEEAKNLDNWFRNRNSVISSPTLRDGFDTMEKISEACRVATHLKVGTL